MPEAAKGTTKKSAEAFVRYAVEVLNYTSLRLDTRNFAVIVNCTMRGLSNQCDGVCGEGEVGRWLDRRWRVD